MEDSPDYVRFIVDVQSTIGAPQLREPPAKRLCGGRIRFGGS
jgi:hypothetical protein